MSIPNHLAQACETAFWDTSIESNTEFRPQFISNHAENTMQVFLDRELQNCTKFIISVAFITESGLASLLQTLLELEKKNIPGQILTTDYLNFTEPKALRRLMRLDNIELKMYPCNKSPEGFHTKGYLFYKDEIISIVIGSSNLTGKALSSNKEWNTRFAATENGEIFKHIIKEFDDLWSASLNIDEALINQYEALYIENKRLEQRKREIFSEAKIVPIQLLNLEPNSMQREFIRKISIFRNEGKSKALLISATGTGKTYAAAFALRDIKPKRALFLVHREQIAKQAMRSFKNVFGDTKTFGLYSGSAKEINADILFATMQTMSKPEHFNLFAKTHFTEIIIDEAHRAGSNSYLQIMDYFEPSFWLGMTASPDRPDGFDIYKKFDYNIAHEIRLQEAMEQNLLCPFHYYGITDIFIDDKEIENRDFNRLVSDDRVNYVIKKSKYFGFSGSRLKGLIFCSTNKEAAELSKKFNEKGYKTLALSGANSQEEREEGIRRLTIEDSSKYLDYIFTVDIFNEGVDIPEVNQVIMLRPTESPIIFIQQLGRGLRLNKEKEFVIILDFIGNYSNNYMIPIALSGDRSYNKDNIRRYVREGSKVIPGASSIHFDEIARKKIYESIDIAKFNATRLIKENYKQLKFKVGRIPTLMDFEELGEMDVLRIFDNASFGSYHKFLSKCEEEYTITFSPQEENILEYISKKFTAGMRVHELELLRNLLENRPQNNVMQDLKEIIIQKHNIEYSSKTETNIINLMTNSFATGTGKNTYASCLFIESENDDYKISSSFNNLLTNQEFYNAVKELIEFGFYRNSKYYKNRYKDSAFQLYSKYTYEEVCRLLEWEKGEVALNIGGYKYHRGTKTYPVFINYDKCESIQHTIRYEDRLKDQNTLIAISKSGRTAKSEDVITALNAKKLGIKMDLFIRKNKDDKTSKEFYYLGRINATGKHEEITMLNTNKSAVEIEYNLETPVRHDLFEYIVS